MHAYKYTYKEGEGRGWVSTVLICQSCEEAEFRRGEELAQLESWILPWLEKDVLKRQGQ